MRGLRRVAAALVLCLAAGTAAAEPPPDAGGRYRDALRTDDRDTRLWYWGWGGVFVLSGAYDGYMLHDAWDGRGDEAQKDRREAAADLGCSTLGIVGLLIGDVGPGVDVPYETLDETHLRLAVAEQARREADNRGWFAHVANAVVGLSTSLYFWRGLGRPGTALLNLGLSIGTGEVQIWTTPTHSLELWEREGGP